MDNQKVVITRDYLMKHRTAKGAWTRHQIEALQVEWPPHTGWMQMLEGSWITLDQAREFEVGKEIRVNEKRVTFKKVCEFIKTCTAKELATIRNIANERKL